jgi:UDP-N-acetylmuramoylalanine--D-glutamate ligase
MHGQHVIVLGLGDSGLAMARWCALQGADVTVWDSRQTAPHDETLARDLPTAQRVHQLPLPRAGEGWGEGTRPALVLKSPGLPPRDERIAPLLLEARSADIPVWGELDLFAHALAELKAERSYAPQLIAITGTNGKTTTTALTALLVERTGRRVATAGNIGPTLLATLAAVLELPPEQWPEVWVLELSSFQLEGGGTGVVGFGPHAATVLNITEDHLDWHGSLAAYTAAKARVFGTTAGARGTMVLNADDAAVAAMEPAPPPPPVKARPKPAEGPPPPPPVRREVVRFGLGAPQHAGDWGLITEAGMAWLVRALPLDETAAGGPRRRKGAVAEDEALHLQRLMPADALRIRGRHNAANALAALALATAIGCPLAPMLHGLREYTGEPHRVQWLGVVGGVAVYDDSKGTNVGATVAALNGLGADVAPARIAVILGGDGKGQDFSPLAAPLARHARAVATLGRDAERVETAVAEAMAAQQLPMQRHATLEEAVVWCIAQAREGDALLLSPACASLDMFRNYEHRAEVFAAAVAALAAERGEVLAA